MYIEMPIRKNQKIKVNFCVLFSEVGKKMLNMTSGSCVIKKPLYCAHQYSPKFTEEFHE